MALDESHAVPSALLEALASALDPVPRGRQHVCSRSLPVLLGNGAPIVNYQYDAVGNRSQQQTSAGSTTYAYDNAGQLTSVTPPGQSAQTNTFDPNGNQKGRDGDSFS